MRYAFDKSTGECRQFQYGGCGGNGNNFASLSDCRKKCLHQGERNRMLGRDGMLIACNICFVFSTCTGVFLYFFRYYWVQLAGLFLLTRLKLG
jgi:hypothetical protein